MSDLSDKEESDIVDALSKLEPGLLPKKVFYSIARLVVTPTYVVVPFLVFEHITYIHLTRRVLDDVDFPGMLCPIGKIILASDVPLEDTFHRLWSGEISNITIKKGPVFVNSIFDKITRGKEISLIHWVLLNDKPTVGELYDIQSLPINEIPATDVTRLRLAINHFTENELQ